MYKNWIDVAIWVKTFLISNSYIKHWSIRTPRYFTFSEHSIVSLFRTSKCQNIGEFGTFYDFFEKKSHNAEKTEREDPLGFFNIHSVAKLQKNLRPFEKKFSKQKYRNAEKN